MLFIFSVPGSYFLMLFLGRWLRRSHGVKLNWSYQLFSVCFAIYFPAVIFDIQQPLPWSSNPAEFREGHDIAAIGAARVIRFAAVDPGLEDSSDGIVEALNVRFDLRSMRAGHYRRQCRQLLFAGDGTCIVQSRLVILLAFTSDNRIYRK